MFTATSIDGFSLKYIIIRYIYGISTVYVNLLFSFVRISKKSFEDSK